MVETQLCKLRGTSDTFVQYGFSQLNLHDYSFSVLHKISSARVLCFVMKDIGPCLPSMLPGSNRTMVNRTRVEGGRYSKHEIIALFD